MSTTPFSIEEHRDYMNNGELNRLAREDACICASCGCAGNEECGHACHNDNDMCTLHEDMVCACCKAVWINEKEAGK